MNKKRFSPTPSVASYTDTPALPRPAQAATGRFFQDVIAGLTSRPKTLPCKYFYDDLGSDLFEQICDLPEYYPTRTELQIFRDSLDEIARLVGPRAQVVEYGSGSGIKTRLLLRALDQPVGCAMIEISRAALESSARQLREEFPEMHFHPICADYTQPVSMPPDESHARRKVAFFPGSTIGNFTPPQSLKFLQQIAQTVGRDGGLIIGVDLQKDASTLEAAYDDEAGVTAEFNLNLLKRINRELGADFPVEVFHHESCYNAQLGRVEMHLVADEDTEVHIGNTNVAFTRGESIHTENSYKYTLSGFAELASRAGWIVRRVWQDPRKLFSVQYLEIMPS